MLTTVSTIESAPLPIAKPNPIASRTIKTSDKINKSKITPKISLSVRLKLFFLFIVAPPDITLNLYIKFVYFAIGTHFLLGFYCIRQLGCIQSTSQQPLVAFCDFRAIFVINTHNFAVIFAHIGLKSFAMALREGARPDAPAGLGGQKKGLLQNRPKKKRQAGQPEKGWLACLFALGLVCEHKTKARPV